VYYLEAHGYAIGDAIRERTHDVMWERERAALVTNLRSESGSAEGKPDGKSDGNSEGGDAPVAPACEDGGGDAAEQAAAEQAAAAASAELAHSALRRGGGGGALAGCLPQMPHSGGRCLGCFA
jgi:hypothetical protein